MHAQQVEIRFPATHEGFAQAFIRLREALDTEQLDAGPRYKVELVFEEVVSNIVNYGAVDDLAPDVRVTLESLPETIVLTFDDDGVAFDPRGHTALPPPRSLDEERIGGFGLTLVRGAASSLDYHRTAQGRNRLTVTLPRRL